jgi:hypothetical protein
VIISQHSGEGKANQYYVRGFNIDHGTASRLPGEPLGGVDDIHTHPSAPRTVRIGVVASF